MADQDIKIVTTTKVSCDGGDKDGGHPRVYFVLDTTTHQGVCPYCGQAYKLDSNAKVSSGH